MSAENLQKFLNQVRKDSALQRAFTEAVTQMAKQSGHDVTQQDVLDLIEQLPRTRDVGETPHDQQRARDWDELYEPPMATSLAVGEEDEPRVDATSFRTGEEDEQPRAPDATTFAFGEEDEKGRPSVTLAIGEEERRREVSTMAMGEEDKTGKMRDIIKAPPAPKKGEGKPTDEPEVRLTSLAVGEEGRKPRVPQPK